MEKLHLEGTLKKYLKRLITLEEIGLGVPQVTYLNERVKEKRI